VPAGGGMKTAAQSGRNLPGRNLQRILGVTFGIAVGIGWMVGSGIMRTPSLIAASAPDTGLIVALWVVGGLHAMLGINLLAELATSVPKAGGLYVYARRAFGDAVGLLVGWSDWVSYMASTAAASVSFAEFLSLLWPAAALHKAAVAVGLQAVLYGANAAGLREGRALQETTSLIKTLMLFAFCAAAVAVAWMLLPGAALTRPPGAIAATPAIGLASMVIAYQMIVGAYSGWAGPAVFSEENKNPERSIPLALVLGLLTTAVLYVCVNMGLLAALGADGLAQSTLPFTRVLGAIGGPLPGVLFAIGAMIVVASCANAAIMSAARVLFALSHDGLLPAGLQFVNKGAAPRWLSPWQPRHRSRLRRRGPSPSSSALSASSQPLSASSWTAHSLHCACGSRSWSGRFAPGSILTCRPSC
jgi:APA family basic amino acid/polyamine antiporter